MSPWFGRAGFEREWGQESEGAGTILELRTEGPACRVGAAGKSCGAACRTAHPLRGRQQQPDLYPSRRPEEVESFPCEKWAQERRGLPDCMPSERMMQARPEEALL